jgi:hypothetical protein
MTVIALSRLCKEEEEVEGTYTFSPIAKCILGLATADSCCIILSKNFVSPVHSFNRILLALVFPF